MKDIIAFVQLVIDGGATAVLLVVLIILAIPKLRKKILGNGNGHNHDHIEKNILNTIENNHLHEIKETLKDIRDNTR